MTEGAGLRQSHFGSGYDAGKARLQAEVEQLKAQVEIDNICIGILESRLAAQSEVVKTARALDDAVGAEEEDGIPYVYAIHDALARLDAADVPAAPQPTDLELHPWWCKCGQLHSGWVGACPTGGVPAASTTREEQG